MLRQVFIVYKNEVIYKRTYGNALSTSEIEDVSFKIQAETKKKLAKLIGYYDFLKYKIAYLIDTETELIFIFVTGLMDDFYRHVRPELERFKDKFTKRYHLDIPKKRLNNLQFEELDKEIDLMHQNIPTKIAVVGFAGVGKTTIKSLIKMDALPLQHIPTISGDVATIQVGKLKFRLFDFAGQDEFKYLWKGFLRGSQAVLVVTESTQSNLDKSTFFLELIQSEVPHARTAIIANKQDLRGALSVEKVENFFKLKTYPMVANRKENRNKMIRIIADVMDINPESSPLIRELFENVDPINIFEKTAKLGDVSSQTTVIATSKTTEAVPEILNEKTTMEKIETLDAQEKAELTMSYLDPIQRRKLVQSKTIIQQNITESSVVSDLFSEVSREIMEAGKDAIKTHVSNSASNLINALNCAFLTKSNPEKYPNFSSHLKAFKLDVLKTSDLNEVRALYIKCLERIADWEA
ncbi:MAG: GTP-binding protein [Candidatus Lokiarchaeota archaeon]|nr:GTP-binding protein [Candidatus Lokiarchaeota archaeon]